jgi:membrane-anchored protein YejM (alkaline phosphatase superfamily)
VVPAIATNFQDAVVFQIASLSETFFGCYRLLYRFGEVHRNAQADALQLTTDGRLGLTLLHLPAPHLPGVYLASRQQFTIRHMKPAEAYFNNLALADHELGEIRRTMETAGLWDKTWVIVSSDHSWRTSRSYDNIRDMRVPFLVKTPGLNLPTTYPRQFNTVLTHDLILAILQQEVTNQQGVVDWLDARAPDQHDIPKDSSL